MTIQTSESSIQTLDLAQLDTVTGGGLIGSGLKLLAKGANKAKHAWPGIQKNVTTGAKWVGTTVASTAVGEAAVRGYDWAHDKLTGGH